MHQWPAYAKVVTDGFGEKPNPSVKRTEMERGIPKQAVINRRVMEEISVTVQFESADDADAFTDWYHDTIKRIEFFSFRHPRTRQLLQVRIKGGDIGTLTPITAGFDITRRAITLEYLR